MRKVKHNISISNPAVMFAEGVESLISDPLYRPSRRDAEETRPDRLRVNPQTSGGNLFNLLMRQFARL
jgi:hypothetical protein